jgi:hypothetical protein
MLAVAAELSAEHRIVVEVQWREEVVGHLDAGEWRARRGEHADGEAEPAP